MNDFRKSLSRRAQQKAIDGVINAPARPVQPPGARSFGRHSTAERIRARHVDNFGRIEGFHATPRSTQGPTVGGNAPAMPAPGTPRDASLLQSTLSSNAKRSKEQSGKRGRKGRLKRSSHPIRKWALRTGLAMVVLALLTGGFLFAKGYLNLHKVFKGGGGAAALHADVNPSLLKGEGDGRINILLLGIGGPGHDGPDLTDTMLVASIDPVNKTASLVSVPRDLWVTASGSSSKINAVYANAKYHEQSINPKNGQAAESAGAAAAEKVVSQVLGIPIHYYGIVDFKAFQQAVDTVGGVDINVGPKDTVTDYMYDEANQKNYYLNVGQGKQHFDGLRALMYARSRHTSARGDFDRTERQRLLMEALAAKVLTAGTYTNPVKLSQLMTDFGNNVSTDMSLSDSLRLMQISKSIPGKITSLDLDQTNNPLVTTGMIDGQSIVLPTAGLGNYSAINSFVRNQLRDSYLAKENANVSVLNGTDTPGLASQKATELKSYGYNVGTVGDAPTHTYQKTVIVDRTNGKDKYTQSYLEKRFGVKAVRTLPDTSIQPGNANFVIILGQDQQQ